MRVRLLALSLFAVAFTARGADLAAYAGNYRLDDRTLAIAEWEVDASAPHVLAFTEFASGRFGVLSEVGPDEFALLDGVMAGSEAARLRFTREGLIFPAAGKRARTARRIPHRRVEMAVPAGAATLLLPAGAGPFPAVVI